LPLPLSTRKSGLEKEGWKAESSRTEHTHTHTHHTREAEKKADEGNGSSGRGNEPATTEANANRRDWEARKRAAEPKEAEEGMQERTDEGMEAEASHTAATTERQPKWRINKTYNDQVSTPSKKIKKDQSEKLQASARNAIDPYLFFLCGSLGCHKL